MARGPCEKMCKLARLKLFKPSRAEGGDQKNQSLSLFTIYCYQSKMKHLLALGISTSTCKSNIRIEHVCVSTFSSRHANCHRCEVGSCYTYNCVDISVMLHLPQEWRGALMHGSLTRAYPKYKQAPRRSPTCFVLYRPCNGLSLDLASLFRIFDFKFFSSPLAHLPGTMITVGSPSQSTSPLDMRLER
jgi:hypothetical protein